MIRGCSKGTVVRKIRLAYNDCSRFSVLKNTAGISGHSGTGGARIV
ncbi:hypothetical protein [Leptospira koniambonensis]